MRGHNEVNMEKKAFFIGLVLLYLISCSFVFFTSAVPPSRGILPSIEEERRSLQDAPSEVASDGEVEGRKKGRNIQNERVTIELDDYPPTGPDPRHDPGPPGAA
ncbi:hypothetical protein Nepgr_011491 [Nepenthes gracilis]|uniref:Transmembrane protein n=1 Tax=Nepenthes gracilis TaxID=150966 RepID=A0AAD3SE55_NEPGR|nr:hypothetical protein Nepgr_011491 [Nepenthes gracilis]